MLNKGFANDVQMIDFSLSFLYQTEMSNKQQKKKGEKDKLILIFEQFPIIF